MLVRRRCVLGWPALLRPWFASHVATIIEPAEPAEPAIVLDLSPDRPT